MEKLVTLILLQLLLVTTVFSAASIPILTTHAGTHGSDNAQKIFIPSPISSIMVSPLNSNDMFFTFTTGVAKLDLSTEKVELIAGKWNMNGYSGEHSAVDSLWESPIGLAQSQGGNLYVCDSLNYIVRRISQGRIRTMIGVPKVRGDSENNQELLSQGVFLLDTPRAVSMGPTGAYDVLFIADRANNCIRRWNYFRNEMVTVAGKCGLLAGGFTGDGGLAVDATLNFPNDVLYDEPSDTLYIVDGNNYRIRKVHNGTISTFFQTMKKPEKISLNGGQIFYSMNNSIHQIFHNGTSGVVAEVEERLKMLGGFHVTNDTIYYGYSSRIFAKDRWTGHVKLAVGVTYQDIVGDGGLASNAFVYQPKKIYLSEKGYMLISEYSSIRKIFDNGTIVTIAGSTYDGSYIDGVPAIGAYLHDINDILEYNDEVYFTQRHFIRKIDLNGRLQSIVGLDTTTPVFKALVPFELHYPVAFRMNSKGEMIICDRDSHTIRKVLKNNTVIAIAGTGSPGYDTDNVLATQAKLNSPRSLFITPEDEIIFADMENHRIRKIDKLGVIHTLAGNGYYGFSGDGELATKSSLASPTDAILTRHGILIIADADNNRIRMVTKNGTMSTLAGTGIEGEHGDGGVANAAQFYKPVSVAERNGTIYVSDMYNNLIRKITPTCENGWKYESSYDECLPICNNILSLDGNVCSGNGECVGYNQCKCKDLHFGSNCGASYLQILLPVIGVIATVSMVAVFIVVVFYLYKNKKWMKLKRKESELDRKLLDYSMEESTSKSNSRHSHVIPMDEITFEKRIGDGGFGTVFKATWKKTTVAVKSVSVGYNTTQEDLNEFEQEAILLSSLKHPNIITFYGISLSENRNLMVVEYAQEGSLDGLLSQCRKGKKTCKLNQKIDYMIDIANGMAYLHNIQPDPIIHRDLKPANILLTSSNQCKVCDFGMSRTCSQKTASNLTCQIGTFFYMPNVSI